MDGIVPRQGANHGTHRAGGIPRTAQGLAKRAKVAGTRTDCCLRRL